MSTTIQDLSASAPLPAMPLIHDNNDNVLSSSVHNNLSSSVPSLSSSRSQASQIAKTYRQAANLFLTRRLPEALSTIEPIINPDSEYATHKGLAPIALASKTSRIKVWVFWLTFLSAVVELGPEEGKHAFGSNKWKELVSKARDGSVWKDIVQNGYSGIIGNVDAEVVVNLATLLLGHAPSQQFNQKMLESYLSAVSHPTFDITTHLESPQRIRRTSNTQGTNTPRDLQTSQKLLELYTLHVLPRNGEWDYAKEFIMMSELLDDERKEVFLQALHELKEENQHAANREKEIQKQQEEQLKAQQLEEQEYHRRQQARKAEEQQAKKEAKQTSPETPTRSSKISHQKSTGSSTIRPKPPAKKELNRKPAQSNQNILSRISLILGNFQALFFSTADSLKANPSLLLRTVLFLLAFALAFGRREIRARIQRTLGTGWDKVKGTIGMGMKVSSV